MLLRAAPRPLRPSPASTAAPPGRCACRRCRGRAARPFASLPRRRRRRPSLRASARRWTPVVVVVVVVVRCGARCRCGEFVSVVFLCCFVCGVWLGGGQTSGVAGGTSPAGTRNPPRARGGLLSGAPPGAGASLKDLFGFFASNTPARFRRNGARSHFRDNLLLHTHPFTRKPFKFLVS